MRRAGFCLCLIGILALAACQQQAPPDTRAADEQAIREADAEWSKVAAAKDLERVVSYYSDDASVLPPNAPLATGKDAIRSFWTQFLAGPGLSGGWQPTKVEVARSGDIGYSQGTYEFTVNDAKGKPMTDRGKYAVVWKKQADGKWRAVVDIFNSNLPAAPAQ